MRLGYCTVTMLQYYHDCPNNRVDILVELFVRLYYRKVLIYVSALLLQWSVECICM